MKNHVPFDDNNLEHNDEYLTIDDSGSCPESLYKDIERAEREEEILEAQNDLDAVGD
jgi:hypothetical protein